MTHRHTRSRRLVRAVTLLIPLVLVAVGGLALRGPVAAQGTTPTPGVLGAAATTACPTPGATVTPATDTTSFTLVSDKSEARYRAQEQLATIGAHEAVGKTAAIIGTIRLDAKGLPLACSRFDVDLRTLKSDEARRDNFLYHNTLQTEQYPLATFVLTKVEGLGKPLADGQQASFTLVGDLTVHGVTKLVSWRATATRKGDALTGSAATAYDMPDFDIQPPKVGPVVSLDEHVKLEVDLTAQKAA